VRDLTPRAPSLPAGTRRLALLDREAPLGYLLVLPAVLYLAIFIAYPFFMSMYMSFTDAQAGNQTWTFVGPANYSKVENYEIRANDFVLATVPTQAEAQKMVAEKGSAKVATEPGAHGYRAILEVAGRRIPLLEMPKEDDASFLGSTIGNLEPDARSRFYRTIASGLGPHDSFLLGTDLVKDVARLEAAYDDSAGITAAFNRNVLAVLNRELGFDFVPEHFSHVARWNPAEEWIEMRLRSDMAQSARSAQLDLEVQFAAGEEMRTEISAKFRRDNVEHELAAGGLSMSEWWTDPDDDFAVSLSVPAKSR